MRDHKLPKRLSHYEHPDMDKALRVHSRHSIVHLGKSFAFLLATLFCLVLSLTPAFFDFTIETGWSLNVSYILIYILLYLITIIFALSAFSELRTYQDAATSVNMSITQLAKLGLTPKDVKTPTKKEAKKINSNQQSISSTSTSPTSSPRSNNNNHHSNNFNHSNFSPSSSSPSSSPIQLPSTRAMMTPLSKSSRRSSPRSAVSPVSTGGGVGGLNQSTSSALSLKTLRSRRSGGSSRSNLSNYSGRSGRSSKSDSQVPILSNAGLDKYLYEQAEKDFQHAQLDSSFSSINSSSSSISLNRYRVSYRPRAANLSKGKKGSEDDFSYQTTAEADELLDSLGISDSMDMYTESIRKWLCSNIFKTLVKRIKEADKSLNAAGLGHLVMSNKAGASTIPSIYSNPNRKPLGSIFGPNPQTARPITGGGLGGFTMFGGQSAVSQFQQPQQSTPLTLGDLLTSPLANHPIVQERYKLEQYMSAGGTASREYLLSRLTELAEGGVLGNFRWNSGGKWNGQAWTPELPSDANIVIHCFTTYLDENLPLESPSGKPFSDRYFLRAPAKPTTLQSTTAIIFQSKKQPPHFKVLTPNNGSWTVHHGRNNLFHALLLFLIWFRRYREGVINGLNLNDLDLFL